MAAKPAGTSTARILVASLVGTGVEFYDFYIYATAAALVFGPLFFPAESSSAQLLNAYASFGLAFLARSLGAKRVIVRMRDPAYRSVFEAANITEILSETEILVGAPSMFAGWPRARSRVRAVHAFGGPAD